MSEAKFTKGPYRVREESVAGMFTVMAGDCGFNDDGEYLQVHLCESDSNAEHMAHLFAAAPEMYDYLDGMYQNLCSIGDDSETVYEIQQLLAKARGESQ